MHHTLMCMEYQGKNSKGRLTTLDDFGLKRCTERRESKNKITGSNFQKKSLKSFHHA